MATFSGQQSASGRILTVLHQRGPMSRAEATSFAGIARSAAGTAIEDLEAQGLVRSAPGSARSGMRGRPSPHLEIVTDAATVIIIRIDPEEVGFAIVDIGRKVLHREVHMIDVANLEPVDALGKIGELLAVTQRHSAVRSLVGIGVSVPGMVNRATGIAQAVLSLDWKDVPVVDLLEPYVFSRVPISLGHDATLGALAEFRIGAGRGADRLLFMTSEVVGLGAAMITSAQAQVQGQVVDHALQAGHLIVDPQGPECLCGSRGCLELYVDGRALKKMCASSDPLSHRSMLRLLEELSREDLSALGVRTIIDPLAVGLISLVNTLGPDRVVISGLLAPVVDLYRAELEAALKTSVVAQVDKVQLEVSDLEDAVILGAAEFAFEDLLCDPARHALEPSNPTSVHT